jgi:hypothetical protein
MAVEIIDNGNAPGHPGGTFVTREVRTEATILIAGLSLARLTGDAGTIRSLSLCRIDRQPPPSGGVNIQVQLNGVFSDSSIATSVVQSSVLDSIASWPSGLREHQEAWLSRQIRIALTRSLDSCRIFSISGSFYDADNPANLTPRMEDNYQNRRVTTDFSEFILTKAGKGFPYFRRRK